MRPASPSPSLARRRAFALVVSLVAAFGAVTACSDDGPPTPAISGENPGEVTIPTLPPTTTTAGPGDESSDTTTVTTVAPGEGEDTGQDATDSSAPSTTVTVGESETSDTVQQQG